jgi:hypothetical protein
MTQYVLQHDGWHRQGGTELCGGSDRRMRLASGTIRTGTAHHSMGDLATATASYCTT